MIGKIAIDVMKSLAVAIVIEAVKEILSERSKNDRTRKTS